MPGHALASPAASPEHAESYFASLQQALREAGYFRPTLVIDRPRLLANLDEVLGHLPEALDFRIVTKSLPAVGLVDAVMRRSASQRLMVFHEPFMRVAANQWPDCHMLLGKPMPAGVLNAFYGSLAGGRFDAAAQVQWLIDSMDRLLQYERFARPNGLVVQVNLEIDVGFHRGGFGSPASVLPALEHIRSSPHLRLAGFMGYDAHISIFPDHVGPAEIALPETARRYREFLGVARQVYGDELPGPLTLNTGGSTTYRHYGSETVTPANDIALGSGLLKPTFCDDALPMHLPAVFIATPVLKRLRGVSVPGLESDPTGGAGDGVQRDVTYFLYGGRWMADPVWPRNLSTHPVYGRSSNQDMFTSPAATGLDVDDHVFFRPRQTESVLLQFGDIAVLDEGRIVDTWQTFQTA
ncbi:MAG: DSD1 family PLP-dependent enzyme [Gammaproteobacteria bacterium]|nr:DSD1 family PLP-dependent enzyme [Gammaproteobacteria bacterium]